MLVVKGTIARGEKRQFQEFRFLPYSNNSVTEQALINDLFKSLEQCMGYERSTFAAIRPDPMHMKNGKGKPFSPNCIRDLSLSFNILNYFDSAHFTLLGKSLHYTLLRARFIQKYQAVSISFFFFSTLFIIQSTFKTFIYPKTPIKRSMPLSLAFYPELKISTKSHNYYPIL